jgi:hypothetical protein
VNKISLRPRSSTPDTGRMAPIRHHCVAFLFFFLIVPSLCVSHSILVVFGTRFLVPSPSGACLALVPVQRENS